MTTHLALVGPTASGKSELALTLARASGDVEIVSLDSMQVYRGMDIGTATPTPAERAEIPHHLVDVADPDEEWSVRRTQAGAREALGDIERRGQRALLVGGTGLYVHAVIDDLAIPGGDPEVRAALNDATTEPAGLAAAYARLSATDPAAAVRIEPRNRRRVVRALEVIEVTGRPFSSFGPGVGTFGPPAFAVTLAGVWLSREELGRRIEARVTSMRHAGLAREVARLRARPRGLSPTAAQAIGYKELLEDPDRPDRAFAQIVRRTRRFARRQRVWFRRDPRITWLAGPTTGNVDASARALLALWSGASLPVTP
ncbi:MAG: tRNA (adenosine(37)-N6)-dimethylallyltransferase MiaA [Actinomycetota bacterium]